MENSLERIVEYTHGRTRLHTAYSFLMRGERHRARAVDLQEACSDSTLNFIRRMMAHRSARAERR